MADQIVDIYLESLRRDPVKFGNNIYSTLIHNTPNEFSRSLCIYNTKYRSKKDDEWLGDAAIVIEKLHTDGSMKYAHNIEIDGIAYVVTPRKFKAHSVYRARDLYNIEGAKEVLKTNPELCDSCFGTSDLAPQYVCLDKFANELVQTQIVGEIFRKQKGMPQCYNRIITYAICRNFALTLTVNKGFRDLVYFSDPTITEPTYLVNSTIRTIKEEKIVKAIRPDIVLSIIKQIVYSLDLLQKECKFIHSELTLSKVLLDNKPCKGTYKGINLDSPVTCHIIGMGNAMSRMKSLYDMDNRDICIFNEIRTNRSLGRLEFDIEDHVQCEPIPIGKLGQVVKTDCVKSYWWKLPAKFSKNNSLITSHVGLPFYRSYDLYIFLITLMMRKAFFTSIINDPNLRSIFDLLWLEEDRDKVLNECYRSNNLKPNLENAINILKKYHIRCDAIDVLLVKLATIKS